MENSIKNQKVLSNFLSWVDVYTYLLDGQRYRCTDDLKLTDEHLADIYLQSLSN